jgi:hypothetical protein
MYRLIALIALAAVSSILAAPGKAPATAGLPQLEQNIGKTGADLEVSSLAGDLVIRPADLQAERFPRQGFAKYRGTGVVVNGTSDSGNPRPFYKVRSIARVSDPCAPQLQQQ